MKRLLYVTPYFPPQRQVGALRPLKFVRHLPSQGWLPTVLCDVRPRHRTDATLSELVPPEVEVLPQYGWLARSPRWSRLLRPSPQPSTPTKPDDLDAKAPPGDDRSTFSWNPEWFPWGEHFLDVPHAVAIARRQLQKHTYHAILVNADPYAALQVGQRLSREFRIPWVADLRDPWSVCELRRPLRPAFVQRYVDRRERSLIESSSRYIINTEQATEDYRAHFPDLKDRFSTIRNHVDPDLFDTESGVDWPEFTLLFLGTFRRFVSIDPILRALKLLESRRPTSSFKLRVVGTLSPSELAWVKRRGAERLVEILPPRPYRQAGSLMETADLLLSLGHPTHQRIVAKLYDYFSSERPILHLGVPNPELSSLSRKARGVEFRQPEDSEAIAQVIESHLLAGRARKVERNVTPWSSATASAKMARILDDAVSSQTEDRSRRPS